MIGHGRKALISARIALQANAKILMTVIEI
jgi:hypothetical protein